MTARMAAMSLALAFAVALPVTLLWPGGSSNHLTRSQMLGFEKKIDPLVSQAGQVVEEGMKPALTDLEHDHVTPPAFIAHEADGWIATLTDVRTRIAAIRPPSALGGARSSIVASLDAYVEAARTFKAAALASPKQREALIQSGIDEATRADKVFDQGAIVIQRLRRSLGLGPSSSFPDPGASG